MTDQHSGKRLRVMPPRKKNIEKKRPLSVTVEPEHRSWLDQNWLKLGYRSQSHAVDAAIQLLRESAAKRSKVE